MKAIYLNNTQIHSNTDGIGIIVHPDIKGLEMPAIRLPSFDRPNVDGAIVPNQLYGGRLISFTGRVYASTVSAYRALRRTLETAVAIQRTAGVLYPITLKMTTMDDLALQVDVYTKAFDFPDKEMLFGNFRLDLFAPSLILLGQTLKTKNIYTFYGGGMAIPTEIPMDMDAGGVSVDILNNAGNVNAYPIITLTGPLDTPTITNETTGESMAIAYNLTTNQKRIVIDTLNRTVVYYATPTGSGTNKRSVLTGDFITLAPGDNSVKLTLSAYDPDGVAQFAWRDSYGGI